MNSIRGHLPPSCRPGQVSPIRCLLSALLVLAATVLVSGVVTEHLVVRHATAGAAQPGHPEQGEASGHPDRRTEVGGESAPAAGGLTGTGEAETVLGVHVESPMLVTLAVVLSLGAAALVLTIRRRAVVVGAGALAAVFVIVDCAELLHQAGEARPTMAVLAGLTKGLHVAAALTAGAMLVHRQWGHEPAGA